MAEGCGGNAGCLTSKKRADVHAKRRSPRAPRTSSFTLRVLASGCVSSLHDSRRLSAWAGYPEALQWPRDNRRVGGLIMRKVRLLTVLLGLWSGVAFAQATEELINDGKNTENVTTQSMGYDRKSYSPLKQIDKSNVKRLVPIWSASLMNDMGELAAPTIYNGVLY